MTEFYKIAAAVVVVLFVWAIWELLIAYTGRGLGRRWWRKR